MGAGAGQTGGGMQQMPQQTATGQAMPQGMPAQSNKGGLGALAAQRQQGGQADPRLMAAMQAFQQQGDMPGAGMGTFGPNDMPNRPMPFDPGMDAPGGGLFPGFPGGPKMGTFGPNDMPVQYDPRKPGGMMPGGVPVQRPLPVGAGGKGTGMPPPGMVNPPRPMPLPPGLNRPMPMPLPPGVNRPMPMPMPPGSMVNPPRPIGPKPVPQPVRPTPKPMNPRFNQIMPFLR